MRDDYWKMFLGLGSVESYLLYKLSENQGDKNGGSQDTGIDTKLE